MPDMPRPLPPHCIRQTTQHGKTVYYVRVGKGPRTRIRAAYGSPDFMPAYLAALSGAALPGAPKRVLATSLQWLWDSYRDSGDWLQGLAPSTRRQRENIMLHVLKESGAKPYLAIRTMHIEAGIERRSKTPSAARNFLDTMQGMFRWAKKRQHLKVDPTVGAEPPKRKQGRGFPAWTREDVEQYYRNYPLGTRQRVWLDVLLYTGPRRGDAAVIGKQHEKDVRNEDGGVTRVVQFRTEKSGEQVTVTLPILPPLQRTLDAGPTGDLTWVCGARGRPFTKESFGNEFSAAARSAGIAKSAHGVRKIAATIAAENGATGPELDAIFGWVDGGRTSAIYIREANRIRLAGRAMHKLDETGTAAPSPSGVVRATARKRQRKQG
jgi:integrase